METPTAARAHQNGRTQAFPRSVETEKFADHRDGLSKREYFTGLAMLGIMIGTPYEKDVSSEEMARCAVRNADALLVALEAP